MLSCLGCLWIIITRGGTVVERAQKIIVPVRNLVSPVISTELAKHLFSLWNIYCIYIYMYIYVTYLHIDRKIDRCFLRLDTFHCFGKTRKYDGKSLVCIEALNDLGSSIGKIIKLRESGKIDERARFR